MYRKFLASGLILFAFISGAILYSNESGQEYDTVIVFRNDDVSSVNDNLTRFNEVFREKNVPVTHSIIPEKVSSSENYNETCKQFREMKDNSTRFAIHGYNHDGFEFKNSDWDQVNSKLDKIDSFSQECLGYRPDSFVAPHNSMSSISRILLNESGYKVISADRKMSWQTGDVEIVSDRKEFLEKRPFELGQSSMMVKDWNKDPVEFKNLSELKKEFDSSAENNEIHVQTVHYGPLMRNNQSAKLESLIDYMKSQNVYFTTFDGLTELFEENKIEYTGNGWVIRNE